MLNKQLIKPGCIVREFDKLYLIARNNSTLLKISLEAGIATILEDTSHIDFVSTSYLLKNREYTSILARVPPAKGTIISWVNSIDNNLYLVFKLNNKLMLANIFNGQVFHWGPFTLEGKKLNTYYRLQPNTFIFQGVVDET